MTKKMGLFIWIVTFSLNLVLLLIGLRTLVPADWSMQTLMGLILICLIIATVESIVFFYFYKGFTRKVQTLTNKLDALAQNLEPTHVLLKPNDPLHGLAMAVNRLQTHHRHLLADKQRQSDELTILLTYLPVGVMVIDRYRKVELANSAMGEFLETKIAPERHAYVQDINNYDLANLISQSIKNQSTVQKTVTLTSSAGERTVEATVIYAPGEADDFLTIVLLYDMTEIAAIERMQRDFLTNASHELKTPVTAITGFAETLLNGGQEDAETLTTFLNIILRESRRLTDLIGDVLSIARIESGDTSSKAPSTVLLSALVDEQFEVMQQTAQTRHVTLINRVPATAQPMVDRQGIIEVLKNLIANAINYNRDDGQVMVTYEATENSWTLVVEDTGVGIATAEQTRIFERFYRVDHSRNQQAIPGTGLGLAIVAELVAAMDGQIDLQSQRGVGTRVSVRFPCVISINQK